MDVVAEFFSGLVKVLAPYRYVIGVVLASSALLVGGAFWYQARKANLNRGAHAAVVRLRRLIDMEIESEKEDGAEKKDVDIRFISHEAKWEKIRNESRKAYEDFASAGLGFFFKVCESDALFELGDEERARKTLEDFKEVKPTSLNSSNSFPALLINFWCSITYKKT